MRADRLDSSGHYLRVSEFSRDIQRLLDPYSTQAVEIHRVCDVVHHGFQLQSSTSPEVR